MSKQEEIREGIKKWLFNRDACHNEDCGDTNCSSNCPYLNKIVDEFLSYLHSQGVVIKINRELPENPYTLSTYWKHEFWDEAQQAMLKDGYVAVEPLLKEVKDG